MQGEYHRSSSEDSAASAAAAAAAAAAAMAPLAAAAAAVAAKEEQAARSGKPRPDLATSPPLRRRRPCGVLPSRPVGAAQLPRGDLLAGFAVKEVVKPIDGGFPHAWAATRRAATAAAAPRAREEGDNGCGGSPCA
uniref:Uncharacterized protein n=1 Tax=Oryza nivara TaxID=4536 RepID=A0A0E0GC32_ORYNI